MKTHIIKTAKIELLIIELPENGNTFDDLTLLNYETEGYTILGKPAEIREDDARELVQKISFGFKNYKSKDIEFFLHAKESLLSAIESEIHWENPIKVHTWASENTDIYHKQWHEAESRTFDRSRTLIFVKN